MIAMVLVGYSSACAIAGNIDTSIAQHARMRRLREQAKRLSMRMVIVITEDAGR
jgi:16S rRNA C967 or C1407 C5-methylase (RsmB/RsmF family)